MLINYTTKELDLLARIMRAEALAEGNLGMLMVGNVVVNRAIANCLTFKDIRTITDAIYQKISLAERNLVCSKEVRRLKRSISILRLMRYGFMLRKLAILAKINGMIRLYQEDTRTIVFINLIEEYV